MAFAGSAEVIVKMSPPLLSFAPLASSAEIESKNSKLLVDDMMGTGLMPGRRSPARLAQESVLLL
jgi:hypothetical protein